MCVIYTDDNRFSQSVLNYDLTKPRRLDDMVSASVC